MLKLIAALAFVAVATAQTKYCCVPKQWEGMEGKMTGLDTQGRPGTVNVRIMLHVIVIIDRTLIRYIL